MKFSVERRRNISLATRAAMARPEVKEKLKRLKGNGNGFKKGNLNPAYGKVGEESWAWRGDDITYERIHQWLVEKFGRLMACEHCGEIGGNTRKSLIQWALKTGLRHGRERARYLGLCVKCHTQYDSKLRWDGRWGRLRH